MTQFCVQNVVVDGPLRAAGGVLRRDDLLATAAAAKAAQHILQQAELDAVQVREAAQQAATAAVQQEQQQVAKQATALLQALQQARQELLTQVESLVIELAQQTFERLVLQLTPRERIEAMLRRIVEEAPGRLAAAVLALHPEDAALLPPVPWEIRQDAAMAPGSCRLEAASGEWRAEFGLAVTALLGALAQAGMTVAPVSDSRPQHGHEGAQEPPAQVPVQVQDQLQNQLQDRPTNQVPQEHPAPSQEESSVEEVLRS